MSPSALPDGIQAVFDHAAHASHRIADMLPLYMDQLGGELLYGGANRRVGYRGMVLGYAGGGKIELLEPIEGSAFLDSFFARQPAGGLHHLTFRVSDLADSVTRAEAAGFSVIGLNEDNPAWREAFVHPRSGHGALVQFVQCPPDHPRHEAGVTVEAILAS